MDRDIYLCLTDKRSTDVRCIMKAEKWSCWPLRKKRTGVKWKRLLPNWTVLCDYTEYCKLYISKTHREFICMTDDFRASPDNLTTTMVLQMTLCLRVRLQQYASLISGFFSYSVSTCDNEILIGEDKQKLCVGSIYQKYAFTVIQNDLDVSMSFTYKICLRCHRGVSRI